jgi:hypothetical protein
MNLAKVQFHNDTGYIAQIFIKIRDQMAGRNEDVPAHGTSTVLSGPLLTIDFQRPTEVVSFVSFDFTSYLPNGLWVQDESPYRLTLLTDSNDNHSLLVRDNSGATVDEFRPAGAAKRVRVARSRPPSRRAPGKA